MKQKAENINIYGFKSSDQLLLDANIWLFIYGPYDPGNQKVTTYSAALDKMLKVKCQIHIDVLVLSEFINRYAKMIQAQVAPDVGFKMFRNSPQFKPLASAIAVAVRRMLSFSYRVSNDFEVVAINDLIDDYAAGEADFNDQILVNLCKRKGFKLVTDDGDFQGQGLSVLTANNRLLCS